MPVEFHFGNLLVSELATFKHWMNEPHNPLLFAAAMVVINDHTNRNLYALPPEELQGVLIEFAEELKDYLSEIGMMAE